MATKRGMNERIQKLRDLSVNTPVHIDLERAKIETDSTKKMRQIFYPGNEIYGSEGIFLQEDSVPGRRRTDRR